MRKLVLTAVVGLISLTVLSCSGSKDVAESPCQKTIKAGCTKCHSTERTCEKLSEADADWPAIVKDMGKRAKLNQEQQDAVLACLTNTAEQGRFECPK